MAPDPIDQWEGGETYERYMGRWSRMLARDFVRWLGAGADQKWIDVGCGTGALTSAILDLASPASVLGIEPSETFLTVARKRVRDGRAEFVQGDAAALPLPDGVADVVASSLVLNFLPNPKAAVQEMVRVVRPGRVIAAVVWDYSEGMQFIRRFWDAAIELDPEARRLDEGVRFPICRPEPLRRLFANAGLERVRVDAIEIPTHFVGFLDFWEPFLDGPGPAPGYVASLPAPRRNSLRSRLAERLPIGADGVMRLTARAWAVTAYRAEESYRSA